MPILGVRILPPMASARFGSSPTPLEAFSLEIDPDKPLDFRRIVPQPTLEVDPATGAIARAYTPAPGTIRFKDGERIRPVAPFYEVFAQTSERVLEPLTMTLLSAEGLDPDAVRWTVEVANLKIFRQTDNPHDKIAAAVERFNDHEAHELRGVCDNFLPGKSISFGSVRYIRPTKDFPEVRLRFTPAAGVVYGSNSERYEPEARKEKKDPVFEEQPERIVYDTTRGRWRGFQADENSATITNPSDIYQGYWPVSGLPRGWGYIDDVCDGPISVALSLANGSTLKARAWVSTCMPAFAPDSQPMRTVADELEQAILGPDAADEEISIDEAADILRRALETVRLMNTMVMNGNVIDGRANIASTLVRQDTNDHGRDFEPTMASSLADNLAVRILHGRVYAAVRGGSAPWFAKVLRRPEEIGDLSDESRRKMPPMLRGADGRALTLTRRQISKIVKAATANLFR